MRQAPNPTNASGCCMGLGALSFLASYLQMHRQRVQAYCGVYGILMPYLCHRIYFFNLATPCAGSALGSCIPIQRLQDSSRLYPAVHCTLQKGVSNCKTQNTRPRSHHTRGSLNPNRYPDARQQSNSEKNPSSAGM